MKDTMGIVLAERGLLPEPVVRWGIRRLVGRRLEDERSRAVERRESFEPTLHAGPVALVPEMANEQHYEVPAAFFEQVLGPRLKYSSAYWPEGVTTLAEAEEAMLELTTQRADLADGQEILELGCGWGSLTLWMAERFPNAKIVAMSNSAPQREFIEARRDALGLTNLQLVTADMNEFDPGRTFDRVVSLEMFEHMRNYRELLRRISTWLRDDGRLFVHVFCHRDLTYPFEVEGPDDWMSRHFFTGGLMPASDLLNRFDEHLEVEEDWWVPGTHYARTSEAWVENLDAREAAIVDVFAKTYGPAEARRWLRRWRIFFLSCAELFGYDDGNEWGVGHYRLRRVESSDDR